MTGREGQTFHDYAVCDSYPGHEVEVWFDGEKAYACGTVTDCSQPMLLSEGGTRLQGFCRQPLRSDEPCDGAFSVDLTESACWSADPEQRRTVLAYGETVEQED